MLTEAAPATAPAPASAPATAPASATATIFNLTKERDVGVIPDEDVDELLDMLLRMKKREELGETPPGTTGNLFKSSLTSCFRKMIKLKGEEDAKA